MAIDLKRLSKMLTDHEGRELFPYNCSSGKLTIGIGRNLTDKGISEDEAAILLKNDIEDAIIDSIKWLGKTVWSQISPVRQEVIVDMVFNLGYSGMLKFKKMKIAIEKAVTDSRYWNNVVEEMVDSKWYFQVGYRSYHNCEMMRLNKYIEYSDAIKEVGG